MPLIMQPGIESEHVLGKIVCPNFLVSEEGFRSFCGLALSSIPVLSSWGSRGQGTGTCYLRLDSFVLVLVLVTRNGKPATAARLRKTITTHKER